MKWTSCAAALAILLLAACEEHTHEHDRHAPGASAHGGAVERPMESATHFTDATELFVEFPALVVGEKSPFAAHVTTLADSAPLAAGRVSVVLSGGGFPEERFEATEPSVAGIFRPVAEPKHAAERELAVVIAPGGSEDRHELGRTTVYPSIAAASASAETAKAEAPSIPFLKEQQWQTDFRTEEVSAHPLRASVLAHGSLRARAGGEARIAAPLPGRLLDAGAGFPHLGMEVHRDQVLAAIAPALPAEADQASLELSVKTGQIRVDHARAERQRVEGLYELQAVPERRVIEARHDQAEAEAALAAARKRLEQFTGTQRSEAGVAGARVDLRSPIDGVVADVTAAPGTFVEAGDELFALVDPRTLWLEVRVAEADIGAIEQPTGAWFEVEGFDRPFEVTEASGGRLIAFGSVLDPQTRTAPLLFELSNPEGRLRVGMFARVRVLTGGVRSALAIPRSAVVDDRGHDTVFVQLGGESFERRPLTLGVRDGDFVEVTRGLAPGERVVTHGAYNVLLASASGSVPAHGHAH